MGPYYLDLALPWSDLQEDDRRFRLILIGTLAAFIAIGTAVASLSVPPTQGVGDEDLPLRSAYIIDTAGGETPEIESLGPPLTRPAGDKKPVPEPPRQVASPPDAQEAAATAPQLKLPRPEPAKTRATARQMAANAGVLAFSDALRAMREAAPRVTTASASQGSRGSGDEAEADSRGRSSVLQAGLSQGSEGIDGDVSGHGEVLGSPGLPRQAGGGARGVGGTGVGGGLQGSLDGSGSQSRGQEQAGKQRKMARSQEEIQEILDRNKSRMYALYNRELRRNPALQGKVVVSITIAPSGVVTACTLVYSELDAMSLERKLMRLIKGIDFGDKPGVPVVTTQVPIEFFPA
ncbi:MAG: AgmX/PglI C-terminal domain-containing protein [Gammaproteobacteria bacterium]